MCVDAAEKARVAFKGPLDTGLIGAYNIVVMIQMKSSCFERRATGHGRIS